MHSSKKDKRKASILYDTFVLTTSSLGTAHAGFAEESEEIINVDLNQSVEPKFRGHHHEDSEFYSPVFDPCQQAIWGMSDGSFTGNRRKRNVWSFGHPARKAKVRK